MTYTSEFDIDDEVFIFKDFHFVKCKVRKIDFPNPSYLFSNLNNDCICYGLLPVKELSHYKSIQECDKFYIWLKSNLIGNTIDELINKLRMLSNES